MMRNEYYKLRGWSESGMIEDPLALENEKTQESAVHD